MRRVIYLLPLVCLFLGVGSAAPEPIPGVTTRASSFNEFYHPLAVDGIRTDLSRWENNPTQEEEIWLTLFCDKIQEIQGLHLYTGYADGHAVKAVDVYFRNAGGEWTLIPSASIRDNSAQELAIAFDTTVEISTDTLRLVFPEPIENRVSVRDVVIRRSHNLWDFRKLTDDGQWTPSGEKRTMWNEPGNLVGLPAAILAALPFVDDPSKQQRLTELVWSHFDNAFGRNPTGRHFSYDAPREIEGVEHGWYSFHRGGIGQLKDARFVLDGAPKHVHYPYHPEQGNYGWTEGWIQFNTAYNVSLAYLARTNTHLTLEQDGDELVVRLRAPLNFNITADEPITLKLQGPKSATLTLREASPASPEHIGRIPLSALGAKRGDKVSAAYGFGYMATRTSQTIR